MLVPNGVHYIPCKLVLSKVNIFINTDKCSWIDLISYLIIIPSPPPFFWFALAIMIQEDKQTEAIGMRLPFTHSD